MLIVVEVVVLWLMIGGDSRHKVVGGAQASLILGSNPVLGTCLLHHSAPPNSTRGDNPRLSTSCRALELQVGQFPALCSFPKRSTLRRCQSGSRLGGGGIRLGGLGAHRQPGESWHWASGGVGACTCTHITYSTLSNIFIILPVFFFSTLHTAMVTV